MTLSSAETARRDEFRSFARAEIAPRAAAFDRAGAVDEDLVTKLAGAGYLGATIADDHGGPGMEDVTYGLLCEEIGAACSSVVSVPSGFDQVVLITAILGLGLHYILIGTASSLWIIPGSLRLRSVYGAASGGKWRGVAPGAQLVSVKVAGRPACAA